jgi:hypothetical protein
MTPEVQAAVERVMSNLQANVGQMVSRLEAAYDEAIERASLLQSAVHERCAERDEARKEIRRLSSALVDASVRVGTPGEIINAAQRGQALADVRAICETALNPQQEGSRDHG